MAVGLIVMVNWTSIYSLASRYPLLFTDIEGQTAPEYDWNLGFFQYTFGVPIAFTGFTALSGASTSLLSKVAPHRHKNVLVNVGTIATLASLLARFLADSHIVMVDVSYKLINIDLVNSSTIPMLVICAGLLYLIKRHFFFLM